MLRENVELCYKGIQRIYRNAVVGHLRAKLREAFPIDYLLYLKKPFQKEWENIKQNALSIRESCEISVPIVDDFDVLSVNHFFNLFEAYYDVLVIHDSAALKPDEANRQKQSFLSWVKTIKTLRDPLSHPCESDLSREDSFQMLDCARRILQRIGLQSESSAIQELIDELISEASGIDAAPLEDSLPPREAIVIDFIGRSKEIEELRKWFADTVSRRWALSGEGGKGKSAIAYEFSVEIKKDAPNPFQTVLWLSAKKRKFIEGEPVRIEEPDFYDLDTALSKILADYGWMEDIDTPTESKRQKVLELLDEFPALIVVDDVDSLDTENENVIEFFSLQVPATPTKVLFTSRRIIFGMGSTTTHVSGFAYDDAATFIQSRCHIMELDPKIFSREVIQKILKVTDGSPLFMEDLMRLAASVRSINDAIKIWGERGGYEARRYALGRECDLLTPNARKVLLAAAVVQGPISFIELESLTGLSTEIISAALQELQKLFLAPKPRLIEGEQRFEVNLNTRALIMEVYSTSEEYRRIKAAHTNLTKEIPKAIRGDIAAIIRQAIYLIRATKYEEAENLMVEANIKYPNNPDITGVLGFVYKSWQPVRLTDAREKFSRASKLISSKPEMYDHWCRMELREHEWRKAAEAAEAGIKVLHNNRRLLYLAGYSRTRLAREFIGSLLSEKAVKEAQIAKSLLERAMKAPDELEAGERDLNADIYRALAIAHEVSGDLKGIKSVFEAWKIEHPEDRDAVSEWVRVSQKYSLG